jgi:hypothetical protein
MIGDARDRQVVDRVPPAQLGGETRVVDHQADDIDPERRRRDDARTIREVVAVLAIVALVCLLLLAVVSEPAVKVLSVVSGSV